MPVSFDIVPVLLFMLRDEPEFVPGVIVLLPVLLLGVMVVLPELLLGDVVLFDVPGVVPMFPVWLPD